VRRHDLPDVVGQDAERIDLTFEAGKECGCRWRCPRRTVGSVGPRHVRGDPCPADALLRGQST
jgi:hypothetical protein